MGTDGVKPHRTRSNGGGTGRQKSKGTWTSRNRSWVCRRENKHPGGAASTRVNRKDELDRITEGVLEGVLCWIARED